MRYTLLTPQQQLDVIRNRYVNLEADHYQQDMENRMAVAMEMDAVKDATAEKRDSYGVGLAILEAEYTRLMALIPDAPEA
jgi:hypothetical protein